MVDDVGLREDERQIAAIIRAIEEASNEANPDKAEAVMWLEDERFSEIEDFVPEPFGADVVRQIHDWTRENAQPGDNVHFADITVHRLAPTVAYATAIQELRFEDEVGASRVTLLFLKKGDRWGLIHSHYSAMPEEEGFEDEEE
ncbi:MAG TPA: SnoaL-like domain-containing protein [Chloroflexi bacterium]|nr:SnoaL-like domain-containing protein [Chloroflexota bacterium]